MTPTLILAILGLAGCALIIAAVVLDYVKPRKYTGWTLGDIDSLPRSGSTSPQ